MPGALPTIPSMPQSSGTITATDCSMGKVRAGFVHHAGREVMNRMKPMETNICPFANLPEKTRRTWWALTSEEMKNYVWIKPELIVQIEITKWTPVDHLHQAALPGFARTRKR